MLGRNIAVVGTYKRAKGIARHKGKSSSSFQLVSYDKQAQFYMNIFSKVASKVVEKAK